MPELPEVETIVRGLADRLIDQRFSHIHVHRQDVVRSDNPNWARRLADRRVESVEREGKRICVHFEGDARLVFHLGMSGQLVVCESTAPLRKHTHLRFGVEGGATELRFRDPRRFGGVWFQNGGEPGLARLGVEPLHVSRDAFARLLNARKQIKALLLDQSVVAGLGNIYVDETLYRAAIHPLTPACRIDPPGRHGLWRAMRRVLRHAIEAGGSSIDSHVDADGCPGGFQRYHRVYGRAGKPCARCRETIVRTVVAGRGTHLCPQCQRAPTTPRSETAAKG